MTGVIFSLTGIEITDPSIPNFTDFGSMPTEDLTDHFKLNSADLENQPPLSGSIANAGNATGLNIITWADGILTVPDAAPSSQYNRMTLPGAVEGLPRTYWAIMRKLTTRGQYLFRPTTGASVSVFLGDAISAVFDSGGTQTVALGSVPPPGSWFAFVMSISDTGVKCLINGGQINSLLYSTYGAAPAGSTAGATRLGNNNTTTTQALQGEFAGLGVHNRAVTDAEMASMILGLRVFAGKKGIVLS